MSADQPVENVAGQESAAVSQTEQATPQSFVNPDGTLKEGWQQAYIPQEFINRPCYKAIKPDLKSIMAHIGNQDIAISRQGKGVFIPAADAPPAEVAAFHRALGVPDNPEGYELKVPEGMESYYQDKELLSEAKQALHKEGLTPRQFAAVMALDARRVKEFTDMIAQDPMPIYEEILPRVMELQNEKAEKELRLKWGDAYDSRLRLANLFIAENVKEEEAKQELLTQIGNNPRLADLFASAQLRHHTESSGVDMSLGTSSGFLSIDQRIEEIENQLTPELKRKNRARFDALLEEKNRLYLQRYPK